MCVVLHFLCVYSHTYTYTYTYIFIYSYHTSGRVCMHVHVLVPGICSLTQNLTQREADAEERCVYLKNLFSLSLSLWACMTVKSKLCRDVPFVGVDRMQRPSRCKPCKSSSPQRRQCWESTVIRPTLARVCETSANRTGDMNQDRILRGGSPNCLVHDIHDLGKG